MPGTILTIRNESLSGDGLHEWSFQVMTERNTVRELIRGRVYQEVQDYNLKQGLCNEFVGQAFQPDMNGLKSIKPGRPSQPGKANLRFRCKAGSEV